MGSRHLHKKSAVARMAIAYSRGGIYLANFKPSKGTEAGKIRPCLMMQSDLLNHAGHPGTTVLPLTTKLIEVAAPLRCRITVRDGLDQDSNVMLDQTRTLDNSKIQTDALSHRNEHGKLIIE